MRSRRRGTVRITRCLWAILAVATAPATRALAGSEAHLPGLRATPAEVSGAAWQEAARLPVGGPLALRVETALFPGLGPELFCEACAAPEGRVAQGAQGLDAIDLRVAQRVFDIPILLNQEVRELVAYFTRGSGRSHFERYLARGGRLFPFLERQLARAGVPRDLVYLSMIESGFSLHAYSAASAVGLWQFMKPTGLEYDLRIDTWVDERRDPEASTAAAARFLAWLHGEFDSWILAFAGYNGGPGRVGRAIARLGDGDYWSLCRKKALPAETCRYVPKILAAALISRYPEAFGFEAPKLEPHAFDHDLVLLRRPRALADIAAALKLPIEALKAQNPALRRWVTPPVAVGEPPYRLRLPPGEAERFEAIRPALPVANLRRAARTHAVKAGETLWAIARRYDTTPEVLARQNGLADPGALRPGQQLMIPGADPKRTRRARARHGPLPEFHAVARGETLWAIARHHRVTTRTLCRLNALDCGPKVVLAVGQRLRLRPAARKPRGKAKPSRATRPRFHRLVAGETLWQLSRRYGVTVAEIKVWNSISDPTALKVGQRLRIAP